MKLDNKGFTLVELLAVIVLLAVIGTLAIPSIMGVSSKVKKNLLDTKIDLILDDAKLYGQDRITDVAEQTTTYQGRSCKTITVQTLLDSGYLSSDKDDAASGYIVNPVDNSSLNDKQIILYIKNKRVVAVMADDDLDGTAENSCS